MDRMIVKRTSIIINDYTWGDCKKLEDFFAIWDPVYYTNIYKAIEYKEHTKQLIIPRGLDVAYIESLLGATATFDDKFDPYDNTGDVMIKYLPRDERQKEALCFMLGETVQYKQNKYRSQLGVNLPTGAGKTYCGVVSAAYLGERVAILTSSTNWLEQWKKCIMEYTDIKPREIYMMVGTPSITSILKKDMSQYKVILISIATIRSYGDNNGWDKVTELFKHLRIGRKYYDECHLMFDAMCRIEYNTNTKCTYYISATPQRSSEDEDRIYQLFFKNIPSIDLFDEEEDPHTHYIAIKYNSNPSPMDISNCKNKYGLDRNAYANYVVNQPNYYKILDIIIELALNKEGKTLIYIGTQNAIEITYAYIIENYKELYDCVGIFTSKSEGNKAIELEKKITLTTTKSCGAAVDIKDLKMTVVLAEPFKSEVTAKQSLGRTRADDTIYIEIVDTGFKKIAEWYYAKKPTFSKYALDCSEIKLLKDELDIKWNDVMMKRRMYSRALMFYPGYMPLANVIDFNAFSLHEPISFM